MAMDINKEINKGLSSMDIVPKERKKPGKGPALLIGVGIIIFAIVFVGGMYWGKMQGKDEGIAEMKQYKDVAEAMYPTLNPETEITSIEGRVKTTYQNELDLEITDPSDVLPHEDGSPQNKIIKRVKVTNNTEIELIDPSRIDDQGYLFRKPISLLQIGPGDYVQVEASQNIRYTDSFEASLVARVL